MTVGKPWRGLRAHWDTLGEVFCGANFATGVVVEGLKLRNQLQVQGPIGRKYNTITNNWIISLIAQSQMFPEYLTFRNIVHVWCEHDNVKNGWRQGSLFEVLRRLRSVGHTWRRSLGQAKAYEFHGPWVFASQWVFTKNMFYASVALSEAFFWRGDMSLFNKMWCLDTLVKHKILFHRRKRLPKPLTSHHFVYDYKDTKVLCSSHAYGCQYCNIQIQVTCITSLKH